MKKQRVVIYARYSSHNQREESIEGQLRVCNDYAQSHHMIVVREYTDHAISGKTDQRPAFQRMIKDAERGEFDQVLVYTLDRFARNRYDAATYKHKLKKQGISILSVTQPMGEGPESIILESVMEGMSEYYSENLARNVRRGMQENALAGKSLGGRMLGYRVVNGEYVLDPVEAKAVQLVFERYDQGVRKRDICAELNAKGFKTSRGKAFYISALDFILRNSRYTGRYDFGGVVIEGGLPKIIDQDLYDRCREKAESRKRKPGRGKALEEYLLSGKVFCGICGNSMDGECGTSRNGDVHYYYKCFSRKKGKGCVKKIEKRDHLDNVVINFVCDEVLTDDLIEELAAKSYQLMEDEIADTTLLISYEHRLKDVSAKLDRIMDAIEDGLYNPSMKERMDKLEAEKQELQDQIVREKIKKPYFTQDHIAFWLSSFKEGDRKSPSFRKCLVDALVNSVYVYDDPDDDDSMELKIVLNVSDQRKRSVTCSNFTDIRSAICCESEPLCLEIILIDMVPVLIFTLKRRRS